MLWQVVSRQPMLATKSSRLKCKHLDTFKGLLSIVKLLIPSSLSMLFIQQRLLHSWHEP